MKNDNRIAPSYYKNFVCKAASCRNTCCSFWRIPISRKEYNTLVTMDCSKELDDLLQRSFYTPHTFDEQAFRYISFDYLGHCPMQKDGLCLIHIEKGEDYLPSVCRLYPRSLKEVNGIKIASCSCSCEKVLELLYESERFCLEEVSVKEKSQFFSEIKEEDLEEILQIEKYFERADLTLKEKIISLCRMVNTKKFTQDFESGDDPLKEVLSLLNVLTKEDSRLFDIVTLLNERYQNKFDLYENDCLLFEEAFPHHAAFFGRVLTNSLIYELFPFTDPRMDKSQSYKGLCAVYGLMRFVSVGYFTKHQEKEDLIDALSALFHLIDHSAFYFNVPLIVRHPAVFLKL